MRQGLLYEEDVKSVTKLVKACINKLMKEWDKKEEHKQTETTSQEGDPATNQPQDALKKSSAIPTQEPQAPSEHGNPEESQVLFSYHPHRID